MTARFGKTTYHTYTTKIAHNYIVVKQLHGQDITTYLRHNYKFTKITLFDENYIVTRQLRSYDIATKEQYNWKVEKNLQSYDITGK